MKRIVALTALVWAVAGSAYAETPLERGSYLVNTIMTCGNCHSPKGPPDKVAGKDFSGGLRFNEPPFDVTAPNITQDKETGIGAWSDNDIKKLMRTGMRPNGVPIANIMPTGFYGIITDSDMDAIVSAILIASSIRFAAGTTRATSPERSASAASIMRPVRQRSMALALPTARVRR